MATGKDEYLLINNSYALLIASVGLTLQQWKYFEYKNRSILLWKVDMIRYEHSFLRQRKGYLRPEISIWKAWQIEFIDLSTYQFAFASFWYINYIFSPLKTLSGHCRSNATAIY